MVTRVEEIILFPLMGAFFYTEKKQKHLRFFRLLRSRFPPPFFLINSGKPVETTGEMVRMVKEFYLRFPAKVEKIFRRMEQVTRDFLEFLSGEKLNIEDSIRVNERLLERLGVVSPKTKTLIKRIEGIGGSAKISGAGGRKGNSGMVIAYHPDQEKLIDFGKKEGLFLFRVKLGEKGVRIDKN